MIETRGPASAFSTSVTRETCSRNAPNVGNSPIERTNSLKILQTTFGVGGSFDLPHRDEAALLEDRLSQFLVRRRIDLGGPAIEVAQQIAQDLPRTGLELLALSQRARRTHQREPGATPVFMQESERRLAQAAARQIVYTLERQVVVGLSDAAKIRQRVADLGPLDELRAADDPIRDADFQKSLFELPHLKRSANQDRHFAERSPVALRRFHFVADAPGFFPTVLNGAHRRLLAVFRFGPQRLPQTILVVGDQPGRHCQDVRGRAIVALQTNDRRSGRIVFEPRECCRSRRRASRRSIDRRHRRSRCFYAPAPAVAATGIGRRWYLDTRRPECSAIFVDKMRVYRRARGTASGSPTASRQNRPRSTISTVPGTTCREPARCRWRRLRLRRAEPGWIETAVFPCVDLARQRAGRPTLVVDVGRFQDLLDQPDLIVRIEDGKIRLEADQFGVPPQILARSNETCPSRAYRHGRRSTRLSARASPAPPC